MLQELRKMRDHTRKYNPDVDIKIIYHYYYFFSLSWGGKKFLLIAGQLRLQSVDRCIRSTLHFRET